jgi:predicted RNase H-like HicB family nuclease
VKQGDLKRRIAVAGASQDVTWVLVREGRQHEAKTAYSARAVRSGDWWAITVDELKGVHSQARRLDQAATMAREAISLFLDVAIDSFEVTVVPAASRSPG